MSLFKHPTLFIAHAKSELETRKTAIRNQHPEWDEKGISTKAEYDYYFALWKERLKQNIPYLILASIGTLSLFKEFFWIEPTLAGLLSNWNSLAENIFKIITLRVFDWPSWTVNYLCIGIGMAGILVNMINDMQIVTKTSVFDEPMNHLSLQLGCFKKFIWILYVPLLSPLWPFMIIVPILTMFSNSLQREWGVSKIGLVNIQLKRVAMVLEPFIIPLFVWSVSAVFHWVNEY